MISRTRTAGLVALASAALLAAVAACGAAMQADGTGQTEPSPHAGSSATNTPPSSIPSSTTPFSLAPITVLPPSTTTSTEAATETTPATTSAESSTGVTTTPETATPTIVETTATHASPQAGPLGTFGGPPGTVVVIDPGHNGQNAKHPEIINKLVPAGFGQTKACNTTGTSTNAGYAEHAFNWQVSVALKALLEARGITVVMTRDSDDGVGPCVNVRADIGNQADAAAVISIHGDGAAAGVNGFFVMTASRAPAGADIAAATDKLASAMRDGMVDSGFHVSNTLGRNGLWARKDLGGLNLSLRPTVMIECGNMRNADEAALMSSPAGQERYAEGLARGVLAYLGG